VGWNVECFRTATGDTFLGTALSEVFALAPVFLVIARGVVAGVNPMDFCMVRFFRLRSGAKSHGPVHGFAQLIH